MAALCPGCYEEEVPTGGESCPVCGWSDGQGRPPLALPVQTELKGRYTAGRVLGEPGGFGVTYLGYDRLEGQKVAIKEYFPREAAGRDTDGVSVVPHSGSGSEEFEYGKEQFIGEAQTLATFDHANIVSVRDFFEANGTAYLVMEYYEGKTLEAYLEEVPGGKMEPEAATEVMLRVLDGLKEVHQEGYLHRDVKPENVYLTKEGRPILIDFGAARQAVGERSRSLSVVMTPGYAPYEQYSRKGNQGPHTDVYGAGATLYRMVTGQKPEPATERMVEDTLQPPHKLNSEVPEGLSRVIMGALAMGDQERTPDAEELQKQLKDGDEGLENTSSDHEEQLARVYQYNSADKSKRKAIPRNNKETPYTSEENEERAGIYNGEASYEEKWYIALIIAMSVLITLLYILEFYPFNSYHPLIEKTKKRLSSGNITSPKKDNAWYYAMKIKKDKDINSEHAKEYVDKVSRHMVEKGSTMVNIGNLDGAKENLNKSLRLQKRNYQIEEKRRYEAVSLASKGDSLVKICKIRKAKRHYLKSKEIRKNKRAKKGINKLKKVEKSKKPCVNIRKEFPITSVDLFKNNEKYVAFGAYEKGLRVWNIEKQMVVEKMDFRYEVEKIRFYGKQNLIGGLSSDGVKVFDVESGSKVVEIEGVEAFGFLNDKKMITGKLGILSVRTLNGRVLDKWKGHDDSYSGYGVVTSIAVNEKHGLVASSGLHNKVKSWKSNDWSLQKTVDGNWGEIEEMSFITGKRKLAVVSTNHNGKGQFKIWNMKSGNLDKKVEKGQYYSVDVSPKGKLVAAARMDGSVEIWSVRRKKILKKISAGDLVNSISFSSDGKILAVASEIDTINEGINGSLSLWYMGNLVGDL